MIITIRCLKLTSVLSMTAKSLLHPLSSWDGNVFYKIVYAAVGWDVLILAEEHIAAMAYAVDGENTLILDMIC